jgi:hypothetical protein
VIIGDPLDSLGLDGVGSPEDTREFLRLMGEVGLRRTVAFWLLHHSRKDGADDEMDEISGAWGGRPDTMLSLKKLAGERARLGFPKIRFSRRGTRAASILGFDPETEGFSVVGTETDEERDYVLEITELLSDGKWRTVKEIASKKEGGIGAGETPVREALAEMPERFESRTGEDAKAVGRHSNSTVWCLRQTLNAHDADTEKAEFGREE